MANSPIQAKGVGKDSKRHDLDGTPGLSKGSSLNQGEVSQLEQGQQKVSNTQQTQQAVSAQPAPSAPLPNDTSMIAPDPLGFAKKKLGGGGLEGAGTAPIKETIDWSNWLPLLRRLSVSPTSSGLLQRAFLQRMSAEMNRPTGTKAALIRQRDFDARIEQVNNGGS